MKKLILKMDVDGLGRTGDRIEVKDGFARNYLFPKKLAVEINDFNLKQFELEKKKEARKIEKEKELSLQLAEKIKTVSCTIAVEAQPDDNLYGSVSTTDIVRSLAEEGFNFDKRQILLDEPIKKTGVYQISVKIHPEVTAVVKVWVVKK